MRRRALLRASAALLAGATAAGCLGTGPASGDDPGTTGSTTTRRTHADTTDAATDTGTTVGRAGTTRTGNETGWGTTDDGTRGTSTVAGERLVLELRFRNETGEEREVSVTVTHRMRPECRLSEPECGKPAREQTLLDATATWPAGETVTKEVVVDLTGDLDYVTVAASVDGSEDAATGLEASAAREHDSLEYDWTYRPGETGVVVAVREGGEVAVDAPKE